MRIRKAFLALHDFKPYVSIQDFMNIIQAIAAQTDIHPCLRTQLTVVDWSISMMKLALSVSNSVTTTLKWAGVLAGTPVDDVLTEANRRTHHI